MKSHMRLLERVLADAGTWCSTSTTRDLNTITRRVEHEGLSFLMITLPTFCTDFERSLSLGRVAPCGFLSFSKTKALPKLFKGLLELVFDSETGLLVDVPNKSAIFFVRQACLMFKKMLSPCSDARVADAYASYIDTNQGVCDWESENDSWLSCFESGSQPFLDHVMKVQPEVSSFQIVARYLWSRTFQDENFVAEALIPKHGPGATAERISGNSKFNLKSWHDRLELYFPSDLFAIPSWNYIDQLQEVEYLDPGREPPVRVIHVPKTLKAPRIIAIEPVCMMYTQQALMECSVDILENDPLYEGAIGFFDQTKNQNMALAGSLDGSLATIDLKDASDRVSARLVHTMLASAPLFRDALFACRSTRADVPGYGVTPLFRFASMGSGMCFPIEAMLFYNIAISAIARSVGNRISSNLISRISKRVRVYGDDIVVPVEYVHLVMRELEWFNLRVNSNKSFYTGKFRESCGTDAYDGVPVTPVYVRNSYPSSLQDTSELLSTVSLRNQLYKAGCWKTAQYVTEQLEKLIPFPLVSDKSSLLGRHSFVFENEGGRWDKHLHQWLQLGHVVKTQRRRLPLDGVGALTKFFLKRGVEPFHDKEHLLYSGRPVAVYTKQQWAPALGRVLG